MKWNDGKERAKFNREQQALRERYIVAGMTEEQIQVMYDYDLSVYRNKRNEAMHTQALDFAAVEAGDKELENPLYKKFSDKLSVTVDFAEASRYAWIDEIGNERYAKALRALPQKDLELITMLVMDRYSQTEVAKKLGIHRSNVTRRIERLKKFFNNFSKKRNK